MQPVLAAQSAGTGGIHGPTIGRDQNLVIEYAVSISDTAWVRCRLRTLAWLFSLVPTYESSFLWDRLGGGQKGSLQRAALRGLRTGNLGKMYAALIYIPYYLA